MLVIIITHDLILSKMIKLPSTLLIIVDLPLETSWLIQWCIFVMHNYSVFRVIFSSLLYPKSSEILFCFIPEFSGICQIKIYPRHSPAVAVTMAHCEATDTSLVLYIHGVSSGHTSIHSGKSPLATHRSLIHVLLFC